MAAPDPAAPPARRPALPTLTSLRALAAAAVFFRHIGFFFLAPGLHGVTTRIGDAGQHGVSFFFLLSGAILAYNHPASTPLGRFYGKRFARIYPVYALAFVLGAAGLVLVEQSTRDLTAKTVSMNLLMLQGFVQEVNVLPITAWTLSCELLFYAVFPFLAMGLRRLGDGRAALGVGAALLLMAALLPGIVFDVVADNRFVPFGSPLVRLPEFALGCLIGLHLPALAARGSFAERHAGRILWGAAAAVVALTVVLPWLPPWLQTTGFWVPIFAATIVAGAAADLHHGPHRLSAPWLVALGLWSYAFYSLHATLIALAAGVMTEAPGLLLGLVIAVGLFAGSWVLSALVFRFWEEPARERLTRSRPVEVPPVPLPGTS